MSTTRIPTYAYLSTAGDALISTGYQSFDFGFDAVRIHVEHTCAEKIWFNPNSSVATTANVAISSGFTLDIDHCGRTPMASYVATSSGKIVALYAFGQ